MALGTLHLLHFPTLLVGFNESIFASRFTRVGWGVLL